MMAICMMEQDLRFISVKSDGKATKVKYSNYKPGIRQKIVVENLQEAGSARNRIVYKSLGLNGR
jgi:hypothetical protein